MTEALKGVAPAIIRQDLRLVKQARRKLDLFEPERFKRQLPPPPFVRQDPSSLLHSSPSMTRMAAKCWDGLCCKPATWNNNNPRPGLDGGRRFAGHTQAAVRARALATSERTLGFVPDHRLETSLQRALLKLSRRPFFGSLLLELQREQSMLAP